MIGKKIAFIKSGSFSHANSAFEEVLKSAFPDYQLDIFDVTKDFVEPKSLMNLFYILKEYYKQIFINRGNIKKYKLRTSHVFNSIKKRAEVKLQHGGYSFTFQTQSFFDASIPNVPHFVYTDHSHLANIYYPAFNSNNLYPKAWIEMERSIYKNATLCFTMSSNISRSLIEQYQCSPEKVVCVFAGNNVKNATAVEDSNKYKSKIILFVGVEWKRKGGSLLAAAFKNLLPKHPEAKLIIVGCSPKLDIPNVSVIGKIPLTEVNKYYKMASIFCMPTNIEPFGIAFIEASAYKLPIIATNIGALPDIVTEGETGYLISPGDQVSLEHRLHELLEDPEKCEMFGINGFKKNELQYNWDAVTKEVKKNVENILNL